jgi:tetratricopeptide (TPR) repeat protein
MARIVGLFAAALALAGTARADVEPHIAPAGAWVKAAALPPQLTTDPSDATPAKAVLVDIENYYGPDGDQFYFEFAGKVLTPDGLSSLGGMSAEWNPDIESLTIHKLQIIRNGTVIDRLPIDKFVTLRRETNLEKAMIDGRLTAATQITDLQVGDIVDFAYTITRKDPVLQGHSEGEQHLLHGFIPSVVRFRDVWPASKPMRWLATGQLAGMKAVAGADGTEISTELHDFAAKPPPDGAPSRFKDVGHFEFSQFSNWSEVSKLLWPLFDKASTLQPGSPLKAEAAKIAAATSDPELRASLALRLVQDQVRYLFVGLDNGGYTPAPADVTWSRRFGDCKGKTVLLLALLKELGVQAEPVMVNSQLGDGVGQRLPRLGDFDHVLVRAYINGHAFWLDGTSAAERDVRTLSEPPFGYGLPVREAGAELERMPGEPLVLPQGETVLTVDSSQGLEQPPAITATTVLHGPVAVLFSRRVGALSREDAQKGFTEAWSKGYQWVDVQAVDWTYDPAAGEFRFSMKGVGKPGSWPVDNQSGGHVFEIDGSAFPKLKAFTRPATQDQQAPFLVGFPMFERAVTVVKLPDGGAGFSLVGQNVDETINGVDYRRFTRFEHGRVVMTRSSRAMKSEVSAVEARADNVRAATFQPGSSWVRAPAAADKPPQTAEDWVVRGYDLLNQSQPEQALAAFEQALALHADFLPAVVGRADAFAEKGDFDAALREYDHAATISADPAVTVGRAGVLFAAGRYGEAVKVYDAAIAKTPHPAIYRGRAQALAASGQIDKALADAETAVRLAPQDPAGYSLRGEIRLGKRDYGQALEDFDRAVRLAPDDADNLVGRGLVYAALKQVDRADAEFDEARRVDPASVRPLQARAGADEAASRFDAAVHDLDSALEITPGEPVLLNARCWARAGWGQQLDQALADCEAALKSDPKSPEFLDSRGLVRLRMGQLDAAIADYDAALAAAPKLAGSLYGRGLARLKKGDAGGKADLDAAKALSPDVAPEFERFGLKP